MSPRRRSAVALPELDNWHGPTLELARPEPAPASRLEPPSPEPPSLAVLELAWSLGFTPILPFLAAAIERHGGFRRMR